jgi:hypothetical protein
MQTTIIADEGTHLLIAQGDRYSVIERRAGHFYNCHDGRRQAVRNDDLSDIGSILDEKDWTDRKAAQTMFDDVIGRENQLAQRM